jgi:hypothetical protein
VLLFNAVGSVALVVRWSRGRCNREMVIWPFPDGFDPNQLHSPSAAERRPVCGGWLGVSCRCLSSPDEGLGRKSSPWSRRLALKRRWLIKVFLKGQQGCTSNNSYIKVFILTVSR